MMDSSGIAGGEVAKSEKLLGREYADDCIKKKLPMTSFLYDFSSSL